MFTQNQQFLPPLHCYYGVRIHSYVHPQHGKVLNHFIFILDESRIQSGVNLGLNHVIVLWFVLSDYPKSAISTPLHCYYGVRIHSHVHPQHGKVLKHFIYTLDESLIQSRVNLGLNHVIVVWFVPSVYQESVTSTPLHCYYGVRIHSHVHPQHGKVLNHFIFTFDESLIQVGVDLGLNHVILVWFVPQCLPKISNFYPPSIAIMV